MKVPAAAFAREPADYDSACVAVFLQNGGAPPLRYRSLGAPFGIEVRDDGIVPWCIGQDETTTRAPVGRIPADALDRFFTSVGKKWSRDEVVRAKNIGKGTGPSEVDWVDMGLIPALEGEISRKLDGLLTNALRAGQRAYRRSTGHPPHAEELYRLVFRLLSGKVFHDRKVGVFRQLDATVDAREVLRAVCEYYQEPHNYLAGPDAQQAVAAALWTGLTFQNLSVDALAFVYENTLVDDKLRRDNGIHSTPHRIARYVVERMPFESIAECERVVVEPCSGHGVFLIAALKRLRDLLDPSWDARRRHRYFADRLLGFERDAFAREVCKLCLTLADFPNPNGWNLPPADVFTSRKLVEALDTARVVLCNPPFEEFSKAERRDYGADIGTSKPLEVLRRVLRHMPAGANLGFVLPRTLVDGTSYRDVRGEIAQRFGQIEIVALPDKVFRHADVESVLLLATGAAREKVTVHFREVKKAGLAAFYDRGAVTREDAGEFTAAQAESIAGFHVPVLQEIWQHLEHLPKLASVARIHRGVEWQPPFDERKYVSATERPGWWKGFRNVQDGFASYQLPQRMWLNPHPKCRRGGAWNYEWSSPKVVTNAVRISRGAWRLAAAVDLDGLTCTQSFQCVWPVGAWSVKVLVAVLNSPVVSAFVASQEGKRHVRARTLKDSPIPHLSTSDMVTLEGLVDAYMTVMSESPESRLPLWGGGPWEERARRVLLEMDALILRGYGLPPWLERRLLDFFKNEARPVPFAFGDYYPPDFAPNLPLRVFISQNFQTSTATRIAPHLPELRDAALTAALEEVQ
ncbi:MAG: N-6 DNA methylase [Chthoniobacteraceae bacterium]